jgi:ubiquitin-activating enzyme E1
MDWMTLSRSWITDICLSQWSREMFDALFVNPANNVNLYLTQPNFVETTLKSSGQQYEQLKTIQNYLVTKRPRSFEECIEWARLQFEENYANEIKQLLYNLPKDQVRSFFGCQRQDPFSSSHSTSR